MKRIYESPELQQIDLLSESLLITASPGVGGDYDPNDPIGAPRQEFFDEEEKIKAFAIKRPMKNSIKKDHWKLAATFL